MDTPRGVYKKVRDIKKEDGKGREHEEQFEGNSTDGIGRARQVQQECFDKQN